MSFQTFIFFILILCFDASSKNIKIIGGRDASVSEFLHAVNLKISTEHYCGGSIVGKWYILTAAHCVSGKIKNKNNIRIYSRCIDIRNSSELVFTIDRVRIHPRFTATKNKHSMFEHDVAVITIKETIYFNECQQKIDISINDIISRTQAVITGWGVISYPSKNLPIHLQKASMLIIQNVQCTKLVPFDIHNGHMCAINTQGIGACKGDSGNGLIANGKLVGIASFVHPCATGKPDMYTRIYTYLEFIHWIIN